MLKKSDFKQKKPVTLFIENVKIFVYFIVTIANLNKSC